jgi:hypothetical protein
MRDHLHVVQLSELIAFLLALGWYHLRKGRDVLAGVMVGLAMTLKFYPGVVVFLLLANRRYRAVAGAAVAWLAVAVPITVRLGISSWKMFLDQTKPYTVYWMSHIRNASIQGIMQRTHWRTCLYPPAHRVPWPPGEVIAAVLSASLIAVVWWSTRRTLARRAAVDMPYAMFTLASLITGPYMWEHYNVTLVLPFVLAIFALKRAHQHGLSGWWILAGAAALSVVVAALSLNIATKNQLWDGYSRAPTPMGHVTLHVVEVANWISTPLLLLLLGLLVRWSVRRAPDAFDDLGFDGAQPA